MRYRKKRALPENPLVGVIFPTEGQFRGELQRQVLLSTWTPRQSMVGSSALSQGILLPHFILIINLRFISMP